LVAVALGARILEKHFTLDHEHSDFRDRRLSAEPEELRDLVARVAGVDAMLGSGEKVVQPAESSIAAAVRRSIAAARDLPAGHRLELSDLAWLRPRDGLAPGEEDRLLGRTLRREVPAGESILEEDVE
jgi:sialic acid synthase SpsE